MTDSHEALPHAATTELGVTRHRLPPQPVEWIDRGRPLRFRFEGCTYYGLAGDTISSALAANGVRLLGRSFKYHRPRGIYSLANHDVNVLVAEGTRTNIRADVTPLWEGADLTAVNTFGGLQNDRARQFDKIGRFLPVGFYYKTFHKPRRLFPFWERQMRAMAGLGAIDPKAPRLHTPKQYDWCDVLVVGGGASGLSAAVAAAEQGLRVTVVDEQPHAGGSLLYQGAELPLPPGEGQDLPLPPGEGWGEGRPVTPPLTTLLDRARALPNLLIRTGTVAAGYYADHWVALVDELRLTKVRAKSVVFATGALAQPALFRNNDLPGVMLASAAQRLVHLYAVRPFQRPVVLTANADGYRAALDLLHVGIAVRMIIDLRSDGETTNLARQVAQAGVPIYRGHAVYEASLGSDVTGIGAVTICPLDGNGQPLIKQAQRIESDGLVMSVGWAPADSLFCQARGKMKYSRELEQFVPEVMPPGIFAAGRLNGVYDLENRIADGRRAGQAAAAHCRVAVSAAHQPDAVSAAPVQAGRPHYDSPPSHPYPVIDHPAGKVFVDLDEDVQLKDIKNAVQEGFDGVELLKRYSTFGMGPSQGKIANTNTIRVLAQLRGEKMGENGSPTARPFVHPVPLGHLAGKGFHPHRQTALHARHLSAAAMLLPAGDWLRPAYYASSDEKRGQEPFVQSTLRAVPAKASSPLFSDRERAIAAEVETVRQRAGLIDVSTLGKLEVAGPDAAEFLERIYTGRFANMKVGSTRYGLMCDESGVIIDDGVIGRLAEDRFYVTTTTTASTSVYREMQRWAILWKLPVVLANVTGTFAAMNLAGPKARSILAELTDLDVSESGFPYLGLRESKVLDVPCRLLRTGFVGEVGYEIHVPAHWALRLWDGILAAGSREGIRPFGVEAQRVLRLEKGHVIVSQDTDGLTNPYEAGMQWAVKDDKPFFVGGRSLSIVARKPLKRRLVGFTLPRAYAGPLPSECHLVIEKGEIVGRVTSIVDSPTLGHAIGLAYVHPTQSEPGTTFKIRGDGGRMVEATVVELPFYDRANSRQKIGEKLGVRSQESGVGTQERGGRSQERGGRSQERGGRSQESGVRNAGGRTNLAGLPLRTSPVNEGLEALRPKWTTVGDMRVASEVGDASARNEIEARLGLCDVSALARVVVKGPAALEFLARHDITVPERIYEYRSLADDGLEPLSGSVVGRPSRPSSENDGLEGRPTNKNHGLARFLDRLLIVRTGGAEFFIEDSWRGDTVGRLQNSLTSPVAGVLPVWRQDVSLLLSGSEVLSLFRQICSFNFAAAGGQFVMTQIAGISCSVLSRPAGEIPAYQIWADGTYGPYLWKTLLAIARELGGGAVGVGEG